jgi:hypothetical protein
MSQNSLAIIRPEQTAKPPDGGCFCDWIDGVDWIDWIDSGQNGHC